MRYRNWPIRVVLVVAAVAVCTSCTTTKMAGDVDGEQVAKLAYRQSDTLREDVGYVGSTGTELTTRPRKKPTATPVFLSKRPLYGKVELGEGEDRAIVFVLDESRGTGSGYDLLYFDGNNNLDLTDDGCVAAESKDDPRRANFPMVEAVVPQGNGTYSHALKPRFYDYGRPSLSYQSAAYRTGKLRLDGERFKMALFDDEVNGRFNDAFHVPEGWSRQGSVNGRCDAIVIDLNKDGKFDKDYYGSTELFSLGKYMTVAGTCFEVAVEPDGRSLALRPTTVPCGRIAVPGGGWVDLLSDDGPLKVGGAGESKVPAGEYRIFRCVVSEKDEEGEIWSVVGRGEWEQDPILVSEGSVRELAVGGPLVAKVKVEKRSTREYRLSLDVRGQGGEAYSAGNVKAPGEDGRPEPPTFKVVDGEGEEVVSGKFEYG